MLKIQAIEDVRAEPYDQAFLIRDLLTSRITILSGEPKAGKTLFAAGLVAALLNGDETFLDLEVIRNVDHAFFALTDDGADSELAARLLGAVPDGSVSVLLIDQDRSADLSYWLEIRDEVVKRNAGIFVLDNMLGSLGVTEDVASGTVAHAVIQRLRPISEAGVPVLLITHTPKGSAEGQSVASSPIGGRAIAGGARGVIALRRSKKSGRTLETAINRAREDLVLRVDVEPAREGSEVPRWTARRDASNQSRSRSSVALDWREDLARRIVAEQPEELSLLAVSRRYAQETNRAASTIRSRLTGLVRHDGQNWVLDGVLATPPLAPAC